MTGVDEEREIERGTGGGRRDGEELTFQLVAGEVITVTDDD